MVSLLAGVQALPGSRVSGSPAEPPLAASRGGRQPDSGNAWVIPPWPSLRAPDPVVFASEKQGGKSFDRRFDLGFLPIWVSLPVVSDEP